MWRDKKKEKKENTKTLIGSGGVGNVVIGNSNTGTTTLNSGTINLTGTTNVTTLDAGAITGTMSIGNNISTGTIRIGSAASLNTVSSPSPSINLGNGATATNSINLYSPMITIGNGSSGTTTIYSPNTTVGTTLSGVTTVYSNLINVGDTGGSLSSAIVNIGTNATTVNINRNVNGTVNIGTAGGTTKIFSPITLGSGPGQYGYPGSTGISNINYLGYNATINNISLPISNYNQINSLASIRLSYDGIYLATWAIQQQLTTAPTDIYSNLSVNNTSITATTNTLGFANWGMTKIGSIIYGSNGSIVFQGQAGFFCNVVMTVDGGAGFSTPAVTYTITRIG